MTEVAPPLTVRPLPSRLLLHRAFAAVIGGALGLAPLQGSEPTVAVIEYRGPSNELVAPLVLASPGLTCSEVQRIMAASRITRGPSQCPVEVTSSELAALTRSLETFHPDSGDSLNLQPELLRVTILERDSVVNWLAIARQHAGRTLDVVEQHIPLFRYPALARQMTELRQRVSATTLVPLPSLSCGSSADGIDDAVQSRIIYDLARLPPTWSVRTLTSSNSAANRLIELTSDGKRAWVAVSYLASSDDAARSLQCRLMTISVLRARPVAGIGDEAYVLADYHLLFRAGALVLHVQSFDHSLDSEKAIATRVIASIERGRGG